MWKTAIRCGFALGCLLVSASPAAADIIYVKEQTQPIRGYFVREDEQTVTLREVRPDGSTAERSIPRDQIEDLIRSVSDQRLSELDPSKPDAYREYAEELAEKRKDPDAQQTSIRLFQIAAVLDPERLGRSCLLGMVPLARTAEEQRRFRAMAYLLDPAHDVALLQSVTQPFTNATPSTLEEKQAEFLLKSLRMLRQGKRKEALAHARRSKLEERLPLLTEAITYAEFEQACRPTCSACDRGKQVCPTCGGTRTVPRSDGSNVPCGTCGASGEVPCTVCHGNFKSPPPSPSLLKRILEVEAQWLPEVRDAAPAPSPAPDWSRAARREQTGPAHALTLETLTEFNPRHNRFVDGQWTE